VCFFTPAPDLGGHPLLDDVEKLESDRIRLAQSAVRAFHGWQIVAAPRQFLRQFLMPQPLEHVAESAHGKAQFGLQKLESIIEERFFGVFGGMRHGLGKVVVDSRTSAGLPGGQASAILPEKDPSYLTESQSAP
jgi:hypothetical protein